MLKYLAAALLFATPAFAYKGPPSPGTPFQIQSIICDTKAQIIEFAQAGANGDAAAVKAAYLRLKGIIDNNGEASCMYQPVQAVAEAAEDIGFSTGPDGSRVKVWVMHIGKPEGGAWMIFAEAAEGGDVVPKEDRETGPHKKATPIDNLCETRSESTLRVSGIRLFWCV